MSRSLFVWTGSILYESFSFRQAACLYFCLLFVLLFGASYLLLLGAGFPAGGGEEGPVLCFSGFCPGDLTEWGHLSKLGLSSGCSVPSGCPVGFVLVAL